MKTHKDLEVWKNSLKLGEDIYDVSKDFPKEELFGLTTQIRRAAVSVPSNISEGAARNQKKEFIRFLQVTIGSLAEVETVPVITMRNWLRERVSFMVINWKMTMTNANVKVSVIQINAILSNNAMGSF